MAERDPFRSHRDQDGSIPPRLPGRIDIREKKAKGESRDDAAPTSISPSGLLGWAARHGRSWNPIGVALMFVLIWAGLVGGVVYVLSSEPGKALIAAWRANTAELATLRREAAERAAAQDKKIEAHGHLLKEINEQLRVQGEGNATKRIVALEDDVELAGRILVKLNGGPFNASFPGVFEGSFSRPADAPPWEPPHFSTGHQWRALKPD